MIKRRIGNPSKYLINAAAINQINEVCLREYWIFSNFPNAHFEKDAKTVQKFYTMKEIALALVSKTRLGQLENGLLSPNMYPAFSNGLRTRYLFFVCLFVVIDVVVVVSRNNPNLSGHFQVFLLH